MSTAIVAIGTPSGLSRPGHEIRITAGWDLVCTCGEEFKRDQWKLEPAGGTRARAKQHLRKFAPYALKRRRESEERELLRKAEREVREHSRLRNIHGEKKTIELAEIWEVSRSSALRFLHSLSVVKHRRDRTWPHGYLWSKKEN